MKPTISLARREAKYEPCVQSWKMMKMRTRKPLARMTNGSASQMEHPVPNAWRRHLAALRPDLDLDRDTVLSTWDDDPWIEAAYSTRTPAFRPDDPALLARPVGPLHFAGEHTAGPWSGLMEGALRSGRRAAAELLRAPAG